MSNTIVDYESAPVPASGLPVDHTKNSKRDEKDLVYNGENDISIAPAHGLPDDEIEPTDEEYLTLRK